MMESCHVLPQTVRELLGYYQDATGECRLRLALHGDELFVELEPPHVRLTYVSGGDAGGYQALAVALVIDVLGQWIPYKIHRPTVGTRVYGTVDAVTAQVTVCDATNQGALARFCDSWSFRLRAQGWLEQAVKQPYVETAAKHRLKWPDPTVERPDLETIQEWLWDDGGCEASDGCWVEVDGTCPHGHPSWLRRLGLI